MLGTRQENGTPLVYPIPLVSLEAKGRKLTEVQLSRLRAVFLWVASLTNYGKLKVQSGKIALKTDQTDVTKTSRQNPFVKGNISWQ